MARADMAGARSQQARAASVRCLDGMPGSGFLRMQGSPVRPTVGPLSRSGMARKKGRPIEKLRLIVLKKNPELF